jgi:hypothetical protein
MVGDSREERKAARKKEKKQVVDFLHPRIRLLSKIQTFNLAYRKAFGIDKKHMISIR